MSYEGWRCGDLEDAAPILDIAEHCGRSGTVAQASEEFIMFISLGTLGVIVLITFMLGMLSAFVMMMNALSRIKK